MLRFAVSSRSRNWPRLTVLAAVGLTAAGCADSARFTSNTPPSDITGALPTTVRPAPPRVEAQPLAPPATSVAAGGQVSGAYHPAPARIEHTASPPRPAPTQSQGRWTWDGGSPVVVGTGDTLDIIARKHGVPAAAIAETNDLRGPVRPGQRLVIPRYVAGEAHAARTTPRAEPPRTASIAPRPQPRPEPSAARPAPPSGNVHVVQPGENLIGIARRYGIPVADLSRANRIEPYAKVAMGDRLTIPSQGQTAPVERTVARAEPQRAAPPRPAPPQVAAPQAPAPRSNMAEPTRTESIRVATPAQVEEPEPAVKKAEPVGHVPSFRWPVTAHIVEGFGPRQNGTTNDGINFAVPEGTPIRAAEDGVVAYAGNELKTYGNLVLIRHADNYVSAYANASEILVKRGDSVRRGQIIAHSGQTGNATSPQLHFEIRKNSTPIDPRKLLAAK